MGNRLSRITTKTGDKGETGLGDGSRISKSSQRIHCIGDVDELNSWVGMLRASLSNDDGLQPMLDQIQHDLFDLGGELAVPGYNALHSVLIDDLEDYLEELNDDLSPLKDFILPGEVKVHHAAIWLEPCAAALNVIWLFYSKPNTQITTLIYWAYST